MTREELAKILETFAVLVLKTGMADIHPDVQYKLISAGIDNITDTVMICNKQDALRYSIN